MGFRRRPKNVSVTTFLRSDPASNAPSSVASCVLLRACYFFCFVVIIVEFISFSHLASHTRSDLRLEVLWKKFALTTL
jgi:hypothetical protein